MPDNPLVRHLITGPAAARARAPKQPVHMEATVQSDGSLLLACDTTPLPNTVPHTAAPGARVLCLLDSNRIYVITTITA